MSRFHIPGVKPEPGIRIHGDKVHLTYSALHDDELPFGYVLQSMRHLHLTYSALHDDELPFGYVLQSMRHLANQRWNGLMEYVIAREEHDEPADPTKAHHVHIYSRFGKRIDITDRLHTVVFDLVGRNGRILHPEVQQVGAKQQDRERVILYDIKDGNYKAQIDPPLMVDPIRDATDDEEGDDEDRRRPPEWARSLNQATSTSQGLAYLSEKAPEIYYLHAPRIENGIDPERWVNLGFIVLVFDVV